MKDIRVTEIVKEIGLGQVKVKIKVAETTSNKISETDSSFHVR